MLHEIEDGLFLGSYEAASSPIEDFEQRNIGFVLSIGHKTYLPPMHEGKLVYFCCECEDESATNLLPLFDVFHSFIERARETNRGILVHCAAGISRSTTCVVSYLMAKRNLPFNDALKLVKSKRTFVSPNAGFRQQLAALDAKLFADSEAEFNRYMAKTAPRCHVLVRNERHEVELNQPLSDSLFLVAAKLKSEQQESDSVQDDEPAEKSKYFVDESTNPNSGQTDTD